MIQLCHHQQMQAKNTKNGITTNIVAVWRRRCRAKWNFYQTLCNLYQNVRKYFNQPEVIKYTRVRLAHTNHKELPSTVNLHNILCNPLCWLTLSEFCSPETLSCSKNRDRHLFLLGFLYKNLPISSITGNRVQN
jgi:hypothetical protein